MEKKILDVTCGARSIWFNKHHPAAVYCDKRREQYHHLWKNAGNCTLDINPDVVCDFTDLPFPDNSFPLVVFDPPHLTGAKETAWLVKKYGKLDDNWPQMLHDGFQECMRVLKPDGVLIFKWSEYDIPASEVWKAIGQKPLFGHHSGKQSRTFWACFMKLEEMEMLAGQPDEPGDCGGFVMDDYRCALLGDREAAKRLTDAGKLLPCHRCGGRAEFEEQVEAPLRRGAKASVRVVCTRCRFALTLSAPWEMKSDERMRLIELWNTRAQVLSAKEMAELERIERYW